MIDRELIQRYVSQKDDAAFTELVKRHGGLVLATARRQMPEDADDITQAVFILLARKAPKLVHRETLIGWLYDTTLYCISNTRRMRARRSRHLRRFQEQAMAEASSSSADTSTNAALLDRALATLKSHDREMLLHYAHHQNINETAARLDLSAGAAAKRVERAIDKLRHWANGQGVHLTSLAAVFDTQRFELSNEQVDMIRTGVSNGSSKAAGIAAGSTAFGVTMIAVGSVVMALVGVAIVIVSNKSPAKSSAASEPATLPATTTGAGNSAAADQGNTVSQQIASAFLSALRDRDIAQLAPMIDAPTPEAQRVKATEYVKTFRDDIYAAYPQRLTNIVGSMNMVDRDQRPISAAFDVLSPINADPRKLSLALNRKEDTWLITGLVFSEKGALFNGFDDAAGRAPATTNPSAIRQYETALRQWQEFQKAGEAFNDHTKWTEQDKPRLEGAFTLGGKLLNEVSQTLQGTELSLPAEDVASSRKVFDAMEKRFHNEPIAECVRVMESDMSGKGPDDISAFARLQERIGTLSAAIDAANEADHSVPRPVSIDPGIAITLGWDGSSVILPGALKLPDWLRQSSGFKQWEIQHDIHMFVTRDDAGNIYEVSMQGASRDAKGNEHELIGQIRMYRADRTLAETTDFDWTDGTPTSIRTMTADGQRIEWDISLKSPSMRSSRRFNHLYYFQADGTQRMWDVNEKDAVWTEEIADPIGEHRKTTQLVRNDQLPPELQELRK